MIQNKSTEKELPTRLVGIDFGLARIGISISDPQKIIASALPTLTTEKKTEQTVAKLIAFLHDHEHVNCYRLEKIIIGFPLLMSGKKGLLADEVTHFVSILEKAIDVPIQTWDERLTSVQADRLMREASFSRKKRSQKADGVAAVIILQNYLDFRINKLLSD